MPLPIHLGQLALGLHEKRIENHLYVTQDRLNYSTLPDMVPNSLFWFLPVSKYFLNPNIRWCKQDQDLNPRRHSDSSLMTYHFGGNKIS